MSTAKERQRLLKQALRDKRVIALVRAGATLAQIKDELNLYDTSHASKVVKAAIQRAGPGETDKSFLRWKHRDRLDALWRAAFPRAVGAEATEDSPAIKADPKWFEHARKILADMAEFEGTNAPKEVRVGGSKTAGPVMHMGVVEIGDLTEMDDEQLTEARRALEETARSLTAAAAAAGSGAGAGETATGEDEAG